MGSALQNPAKVASLNPTLHHSVEGSPAHRNAKSRVLQYGLGDDLQGWSGRRVPVPSLGFDCSVHWFFPLLFSRDRFLRPLNTLRS